MVDLLPDDLMIAYLHVSVSFNYPSMWVKMGSRVCSATGLGWRAAQGHNSGGGELQSESWSRLRVPRPVRRPRLGLSGSQAHRHPGTYGSLGKAENGVGTCGLDLARGQGEKGSSSWSHGESPWLDCRLRLGGPF